MDTDIHVGVWFFLGDTVTNAVFKTCQTHCVVCWYVQVLTCNNCWPSEQTIRRYTTNVSFVPTMNSPSQNTFHWQEDGAYVVHNYLMYVHVIYVLLPIITVLLAVMWWMKESHLSNPVINRNVGYGCEAFEFRSRTYHGPEFGHHCGYRCP